MLRQSTALAAAGLILLAAPLAAQDSEGEAAATEGTTTEQTTTAEAAPTADPATVVATVDGTDITLGEMVVARNRLPPQYRQLPPEVLFDGLLDQLIQQELLAKSLDDVPQRVELALANERRSLLAGEVIDSIVQGAASEEEVRAAYEEQYGNAEPQQEYNASHILVETQEEAQDVVGRLESGEEFEALAEELSQDPGSGANGGQLGWFGPGMMVEPFQNAVESLEPGAVSEPIETQFGWHVIRLNETREQEPPPFEEVAGEIQSELQQAAVQAHIDELMSGAEITRPEAGEIDPAALADPAILEE